MKTFTAVEAAQLLGIKPQTLRLWRMIGKGPAYVRLGGPRGRAVYLQEDVEGYLRGQRFTSTSEEAARAAEARR